MSTSCFKYGHEKFISPVIVYNYALKLFALLITRRLKTKLSR